MLSTVVPSFNSEKHLELCLQSLRSCKCPEVEFIFIDGGSTDATMSIVQRYADLFSVIESEKDRGQSHALNKGFRRAQGRYLTWLNADDCYVPSEFKLLLRILSQGDSEWYACNQLYVDNSDKIVKFLRSGSFEKWALRYGILHVFGPSTIFSRKLFNKHGPFSESFNYAMDSEYWRRLASAGLSYERLNLYLWAFRLHPGSKTSASITLGRCSDRMLAETRLIEQMYNPEGSEKRKCLGVALARLNRMLNGSYLKALWFTLRFRGEQRTKNWG